MFKQIIDLFLTISLKYNSSNIFLRHGSIHSERCASIAHTRCRFSLSRRKWPPSQGPHHKSQAKWGVLGASLSFSLCLCPRLSSHFDLSAPAPLAPAHINFVYCRYRCERKNRGCVSREMAQMHVRCNQMKTNLLPRAQIAHKSIWRSDSASFRSGGWKLQVFPSHFYGGMKNISVAVETISSHSFLWSRGHLKNSVRHKVEWPHKRKNEKSQSPPSVS